MSIPDLRISCAALIVSTALSCLPGSACPCSEIAKPFPQEKALDTAAGVAFTHTAAYRQDFASAVRDAKLACLKYVGQPKVAIVSDLDETILDNRPFLSKTPKHTIKEFIAWIETSQAPLLNPTAQFLHWARQRGFAIFFITARPERARPATIENLVRDKVAYDGLYMRKNDDTRLSEEIKTDHRKAIEEMGFKIVVNIGDQLSDLYGGYAEDCEKLPNKMYYIP